MSQSNDDAFWVREQPVPDVPDFDMIRPIGRGGFGQVWLATNRTTGHLRAVKVISLRPTGRADPAAREITSLTRLEANLGRQHPNLLHIHHVGKTARYLFYVMDPADDVAGTRASDDPNYRPATLQARLQDGPPGGKGDRSNLCIAPEGRAPAEGWSRQIGPVPFSSALPPEVCLDYARQLLSGLASLHAAGMVHRDVKPANCLFVDGQLKLADFGLVTESHPLVSRLGTQKYMPPDGRMDMRADVYAAGLVIYEMLSGLPADDFPRLGRQSHQVCGNPVLAQLLRLVLRACEREPEKRFADARAMLAELAMPATAAPRRPERRIIAAVSAAAVLIAAGLAVWTLLPRRVDVSFVTEPYEAMIYLDGELLHNSAGEPYTTPCTITVPREHGCRVAFECDGRPRWDAGQFDLARTQQIVSPAP